MDHDWSRTIAEEQAKQEAEKQDLELLLLKEAEAEAKLAECALLEEAQRDLAGFTPSPEDDLQRYPESVSPDRERSPKSTARGHASGSLSPSGAPPHVIVICDPSQRVLAQRIVDMLGEEGFEVLHLSAWEGAELTPKQVRRLAEDFLQAQHAIAAHLRPPTLNTLSLCRPGSCFHSSAVASSSQTSA